jgi:serine phosphatase RsbU (regulator of sigma subunit)
MSRPDPLRVLLALGLLAFAIAGLSIADMFLPRPYDGIVLEADSPHRLRVQTVMPGSGAAVAGIVPGDTIVGIDRSALRTVARGGLEGDVSALRQAAELIARHEIGDRVPYLLRRGDRVLEAEVELGRRMIGSPAYLAACFLGFAFFFVGTFVLLRQPKLRAAWVFYAMGALFLLFLVCRLRPASYSWVDTVVLATGSVALVFLPATFLHFFLVFPRPFHWSRDGRSLPFGLTRRRWGLLLGGLYLLPPLVFLLAAAEARQSGRPPLLISGAPAANWWVLAGYLVLGLLAVSLQSRVLPDPRQRRGAALVALGAVFGLLPFIVLAVVFPSVLHTEEFLYFGVLPLALVPVTFAYAIVRYELLDIRVIIRKSLLYTATSALVTAFYALGIASFNALFRATPLARSAWFPVLLALGIVVVFEPLRRRIQGPIDRFFFAERLRLQAAMEELGAAFAVRVDLGEVVRDLVERLPGLLGVRDAGLYLAKGGELVRVAGPESLPSRLPAPPGLHPRLQSSGGLARVSELPFSALGTAGRDLDLEPLAAALAAHGVELVGDLASRKRGIGVVVLGGRQGQVDFERDELRLLAGLLHQAAVALDTSLLVEERTRQAELERELEIAASIQRSLLPDQLTPLPGWQIAAACRPARHVGGDFYVELPGQRDGQRAVAYGDVSGKSVSGALMMMAAHEVLYALAMAGNGPKNLLDLANERLYRLGRRSFVAVGLFSFSSDEPTLRYSLAGQPQPLKRARGGQISELALPSHRLPLGALLDRGYEEMETTVRAGELVLGYSDGVIDATAPDGELFGLERLTRLLADTPPEPQLVVQAVLSALEAFTGGQEPYDDVTLVAVGRQQETMYA